MESRDAGKHLLTSVVQRLRNSGLKPFLYLFLCLLYTIRFLISESSSLRNSFYVLPIIFSVFFLLCLDFDYSICHADRCFIVRVISFFKVFCVFVQTSKAILNQHFFF